MSESCNSPKCIERKHRIEQWTAINGGHAALRSDLLKTLQEEAQRTTKEYDVACARIRSAATNQASAV